MLKLTISLTLVTLVACLQCPNNDICEAGQTCCQAPSGDTSCCPFHHGECCEDHQHCCPKGMLCQVMKSMCQNATHSLPWVERMHVEQTSLPKSFRMIPSLPASENEITCLDGCCCPAEFSCLRMSTSYGCCPVAQGIVCSDGKHCCPKGHTCSGDSSSCVKHKAAVATPEMSTEAEPITNGQITTTPSQSVFLELYDVPCDDTVGCPDNSTCCKTKDGGWSCCPLPQAVCCDDFTHCCPHGKKCNLAAMTCDDPSGSVPWFRKVSAQPINSQKLADTKVFDVPCDDTVGCPDNSTCCKTKDGGWSCCPLPEAVCCDDFTHCCPHGKKCNLAAMTCDDPSGSVPWFRKVSAQPINSQKLADTKVTSVLSVFDVPCDDTVGCPDNSTCCKTKDGGWSCCPLPEAVCCDDFTHCCPHGKKCNLAAMTCDDSSGSVPWFRKVSAQPINSQKLADTKVTSVLSVFDVPCDDTVGCPDNSTCCKTKDGGWSCCPLPEAVCCDDFTHCCPHGKKCNLAAMTCDDSSGSVPWFRKVSAQPINSQKLADTKVTSVLSVFDVPCDDTVGCPDNSTCCKTKDGGWSCCPLPEAVCCDDFTHCCPHGKKCNLAAMTCDDSSGSVPWFRKVSAQPINSQKLADTKVTSVLSVFDVPCDDTVGCPDNSTCCKTKDGGWSCCPLPEAVCCDDFTHCCPHGKKCNLAAMTCDDPSGSVPWFRKVSAQPINSQKLADTKVTSVLSVFDVPCDDTVGCPDNSTCCKTKDGGWACCPLPEAVCCDDFIHCCPHGKKCDMAAMTCDDPSGSVPWSEKMPARPRAGQRSNENVSCDSDHACPESSTCCKDINGDWSCCPMPEAVCCLDHFHCCPQGTTCNFITLTCDSGSTSLPMTLIIPTSTKEDHREEVKKGTGDVRKYTERVPCDAHTSCPDHTTCCFIVKINKWGCCPLPDAVCCKDGEHCCPAHYECDMSKVSCIKKGVIIPWYNKIAAQSTSAPTSDLGDVRCDDRVSCSTGSTCCRMSTGKWGCCPLPEAVCCPDHEHCCPKGYTCDMGGSSCVKNLWVQVDQVPLTHIGSKEPQPISSVKDIQCGDGYSCLDGETCCPTSETSWGCCPSSKAVCCDDMKHCCPAGYKCTKEGNCTKA